ncbi:MAG: hypothetical protein ACTHMS_15600 [Jatrophihabitans sp.]|uniref:hypothetical protein n=1 Tax=Jatrophihabitans sp. TaxID=1932789 RepID=UPI003F8000DB
MKRHKNASYDPNEQPPTTNADFHGGVMSIPRSRGALSGVLLIIFGAWAALIPLIGPSFHYSYGTTKSWDFSAARWWLEILPGAVAVLAGLILIMTANRATAQFAAWIGAAAGAWLIIGRDVASWWHLGSPGVATSTRPFARALEALGMFSGIGALIVFTGALAVGRLSVRSGGARAVAPKPNHQTQKPPRHQTQTPDQRGPED